MSEELLESRKPIECRWVFKIKYNSNENVEKFKLCLIIQGYSQILKLII